MCVISKIEEIQFVLMGHKFPKSGYNKYSGNKYHELRDIMPPIMKECHARDLVLLFNFTQEAAYLDVTDKNNVENFYRFSMPMPKIEALNKKMNEIQSIGADSTYLKRYLLVNSFLILEDDVADALPPEDEEVEKSKPKSNIPPKINEVLIELDKTNVKVTKASVFSRLKEKLTDDDDRKEYIKWIDKNIEEAK